MTLAPERTLSIVGLGPGRYDKLTLEAAEVLAQARRVHVRTERHPTVPEIRARYPSTEIIAFDEMYEQHDSFESVYGAIVNTLLEAVRHGPVVYCVPGSPSVDETTVRLLRELGPATKVDLRLIDGVSYIEAVLSLIGASDTSWVTVIDGVEVDLMARQNAVGENPHQSGKLPIRTPWPSAPLLLSQIYDRTIASSAKIWLSRYWPEDHEVMVISGAGTMAPSAASIPLYALDRRNVDHLTTIFVPAVAPNEDVATFDGLLNVTRTLRAPGGCPWDREQTHDTLKPHLVEEAYEVIEALDARDYDKLAEELGDLLFQVTIHAQVAAEHGEFGIDDVIGSITRKLIRRHPHVFGDLDLPTSAAVLERWESFKDEEKPDRESILSGIPTAMPSLPYSHAIQRRAAAQGFEWPNIDALLEKTDEELRELRHEISENDDISAVREELGDLFFVLVSVARRLRIDPDEALRTANRKFVTRFRYVEDRSRERTKRLTDLSSDELDRLWQEAKEAS